MPGEAAYPIRQPRSQRTLDRLLDAAEALLEEGGPGAATVPAIAARAEVSVGILYRRFPDKDALLRSVYLRFFERSLEGNREALDPARWEGVPLERRIGVLVPGMVEGYRGRRSLLRALFLYADSHPDPEFRRRAAELSTRTLRWLEDLLLERSAEIRHPDPGVAVRFVLRVIGLTLRGFALADPSDPASSLLPVAEEDLAGELTRLATTYLAFSGGE